MRTIKLLIVTGALLLWVLAGTAWAGFPFMEPRTGGSMDVPPVFSLFNKPVTGTCVETTENGTPYAYAAWPFSGNTADSDRNAEKSPDRDCEKKSCCSEEESEQKPNTGANKEGAGTG